MTDFSTEAVNQAIEEMNQMKTSKQERTILAAVFAGTNLGLEAPEPEEVRRLVEGGHSLSQAIFCLWSAYMDSTELEIAIYEEAQSWEKELFFKTREKVREIWPYNAALFWDDVDYDLSA